MKQKEENVEKKQCWQKKKKKTDRKMKKKVTETNDFFENEMKKER